MTDQADDGSTQTPPAPKTVSIDKAEYDRLQAAARVAEKERKEREKREAADEARRAREAADSEALRAQLAERDRRDNLRDAITERQLTPSQAKLVLRLADLGDPSFDPTATIDSIAGEYADIFAAPEAPPTPETRVPQTPQPPSMRRAGPAPAAPQKTAPFEGYISPEEYANYPQAVRLSPKFRERVEMSKPYWPTTFNPHAFPQSN